MGNISGKRRENRVQILGALFIIIGGLGVGYGYVEKERNRIAFVEKWECIMYLFLSEITYKKQPLCLACQEIGEKTGGEEGIFLKHIGERMEERKGKGFCSIWQEECVRYFQREKMPKEEQLLLQEFGMLTGFEDENMQKKMIEEQARKWKKIRWQKQEEYQERKRLAMILSSCVGIMIVLILW